MTRRQIYFTIAFLALTGALVLFFWPRETKQPLLHLKIVRQTEEEGKPVVFFKVEVAERRRIHIYNVMRVSGDRAETAIYWGPGGAVERKGFWAPSQGSLNGPQGREGLKEIGVLAPMNTAVWKLRVTVAVGERSPLNRLRRMPELWKFWRGQNQSVLAVTRQLLNARYFTAEQEIESDWITNAVPKL